MLMREVTALVEGERGDTFNRHEQLHIMSALRVRLGGAVLPEIESSYLHTTLPILFIQKIAFFILFRSFLFSN